MAKTDVRCPPVARTRVRGSQARSAGTRSRPDSAAGAPFIAAVPNDDMWRPSAPPQFDLGSPPKPCPGEGCRAESPFYVTYHAFYPLRAEVSRDIPIRRRQRRAPRYLVVVISCLIGGGRSPRHHKAVPTRSRVHMNPSRRRIQDDGVEGGSDGCWAFKQPRHTYLQLAFPGGDHVGAPAREACYESSKQRRQGHVRSGTSGNDNSEHSYSEQRRRLCLSEAGGDDDGS